MTCRTDVEILIRKARVRVEIAHYVGVAEPVFIPGVSDERAEIAGAS